MMRQCDTIGVERETDLAPLSPRQRQKRTGGGKGAEEGRMRRRGRKEGEEARRARRRRGREGENEENGRLKKEKRLKSHNCN